MSFRAVVIVAAPIVALAGTGAASADDLAIELSEAKETATIIVRGLSEAELTALTDDDTLRVRLANLLQVYAGEDPRADQPPVLGAVKIQDGQLVFTPRFPLKPGMAYRVVLSLQRLTRGNAGSDEPEFLEQVVRVAEDAADEPTVVAAVYPSGDVLPENLLKFYLHFSAPMAQGYVYRSTQLVDDQGTAVDYPFVNVGQELWDPSGTRLTLLLDPGRIKRGLRPREELGPILHEGRRYELVIDGAWPDAKGRPLGATFRKSFRVAPPDDVQPDPERWQVDPPAALTRRPLVIRFQEPLDHAMLSSSFDVFDEHKRQVAGRIQVDEEETRWQFVPESEWSAGEYQVVVEAVLEDRAGNSIERPFEVDVFEEVQAKVTKNLISLPFRVTEGRADRTERRSERREEKK